MLLQNFQVALKCRHALPIKLSLQTTLNTLIYNVITIYRLTPIQRYVYVTKYVLCIFITTYKTETNTVARQDIVSRLWSDWCLHVRANCTGLIYTGPKLLENLERYDFFEHAISDNNKGKTITYVFENSGFVCKVGIDHCSALKNMCNGISYLILCMCWGFLYSSKADPRCSRLPAKSVQLKWLVYTGRIFQVID